MPKFDPSGRCLFAPKSTDGVKTLPSDREKEAGHNTLGSTGESSSSPWSPTSMEQQGGSKATPATIPESSIEYNTQRPNGAVLFPSSLKRTGPMVVLEPNRTVVPVGEELVMVASYVGPNNEYLRTGEKLQWNLDGAGHFMTSNPKGQFQACDLAHTTKTGNNSLETVTSNQLWRIHRGTTSPADDVTILRGQSWITLQSNQEGTSTVSVLAPNIDNWENRTSTASIHWLDALFLFPKSGIAPTGQPQTLSTSIIKKSNKAEVRRGWTVRYEVVSGPPAGFGPQLAPVLEVVTDSNGQANVVLTQKEIGSGTNQIQVKVYRPATDSSDSFVAAEKQITQNWTSTSFFSIKLDGPRRSRKGVPGLYKILITNLTATAQDAVIRMPIPAGAQLLNSTPSAITQGGLAVWNLENLPGRSTQTISFNLVTQQEGAVDLFPRVDRRANVGSGSYVPSAPAPSYNPAPSGIPSLPTPSAPNSPSTGKGNFFFNIESPFPQTARQNEPFNIVFSLKNPSPSNVSKIVFLTSFPAGVAVLSEGQRYGSSPIDFGNQPLSQVLNKTYPLTYVAATTGKKTIILQAKAPDGSILASYAGSITIVPGVVSAPQQSGDKAAPNVTISVQPKTASASPNFALGSQVPFMIRIRNNENYAISNLRLICTPEQNRLVRPWSFVQSQPSGASPVSTTGSWDLVLPTINASSELVVSMTFKGEKAISNGIFDVELRASGVSQPVAAKQLAYSIVAMRQY